MAGMKAADGLNLRASGHSGFFPCPDALNGNRIIITPPQGRPGSRGRQPLRRERAASSPSFRAALRARGGLGWQRTAGPPPSAPTERSGRGGAAPARGEGVMRGHPPPPHTQCNEAAPKCSPNVFGVFFGGGGGEHSTLFYPHSPFMRGRTLLKSAWGGAAPVPPTSFWGKETEKKSSLQNRESPSTSLSSICIIVKSLNY